MKKVFFIVCILFAVALAVLTLLLGCSQDVTVSEVFNAFAAVDDTAPVLLGAYSESSSTVRLDFSEPVKLYGHYVGQYSAQSEGKSIYIVLPSTLEPGVTTRISGRVRDYAGNTCGFSIQVWGLNPRLPKILINEFTTKGTEKSPDRTELRILEDGNLNGMVLYGGVPDDWDVKYLFPDMNVRKDDLVVIWWTEELPQDVESKGGVINICASCSENLSSNNGTLVLCETPSIGACIIDAVVYSNFSSSYQGFGTKGALQRAQWVIECGAWSGDALDSTSSTATRSVCRFPDGRDSDSAGDWFITVTGGSTFGTDNTSEPYS